jgi:aspartyl-tRNA(Asn)/glutamyl-tRNA(Gln) amidotransferase subunit C
VKISEQEVRRVADLANLALREDEIARMTQDLDGILSHMDKLNELETTNVEPMAQVSFRADEAATLRDDREQPSLTNEEAVGNAPAASGGYYKVPRVIER